MPETSDHISGTDEGQRTSGEGGESEPTPDDGRETALEDPSGKPTVDEPTGPALEPGPDEFDKQAEDHPAS